MNPKSALLNSGICVCTRRWREGQEWTLDARRVLLGEGAIGGSESVRTNVAGS
jgi:hypothetical protein